jgi:hypothetical protein
VAVQVGSVIFAISADLTKIRGQLNTLEQSFNTSFSKISSLARGLGNVLGVGLGVGALTGFTKSVVDAAGHLVDLQQQTGISAQVLSGLESTLLESGSSVDAFASAVFRAQKNLGDIQSDTEAAARAAKTLGLDYRELIKLSPEQFFDKIATSLSSVENQNQRNALGAALLGREFRTLSPIIGTVAGRLDEFRKAGLTEEDLQRLDAAGDTFTRLGTKIKIFAGEVIADAIRAIDKIRELIALSSLAQKEGGPGALAGGVGTGGLQIGGAASPLEGALKPAPKAGGALLTTGLSDAQKKLADELKRTSESIEQQNERLQAQIIELQRGKDAAEDYLLTQQEMREAAKGLTSDIVQEQDRRRQLTADLRAEAQARALNQEATRAWVQAFEEGERKQVEASKTLLGILEDIDQRSLTPMEQTLAEINQRYDDMIAKLVIAGQITGNNVEKQKELLEFFRRQDLLRAKPPEWTRGFDVVGNEPVPGTDPNELGESWRTTEGLIRGAARGITDSMRSIALGTQEAGEAFRNLGVAILASLTDAIIQLTIITPLIESMKKALASTPGSGGGGGGFWGFLGGLFGGLFGGSADNGMTIPGPIGAPRLIMAHAGETILPTHKSPMGQFQRGWQGAGAQQTTVQINGDIIPRGQWATPQDVVRITSKSIKDQTDVYVAMRNYGPKG